MSEREMVHRNLLGDLEVPDWPAWAQELRDRKPQDDSTREFLEAIYELFPEARPVVVASEPLPDAPSARLRRAKHPPRPTRRAEPV